MRGRELSVARRCRRAASGLDRRQEARDPRRHRATCDSRGGEPTKIALARGYTTGAARDGRPVAAALPPLDASPLARPIRRIPRAGSPSRDRISTRRCPSTMRGEPEADPRGPTSARLPLEWQLHTERYWLCGHQRPRQGVSVELVDEVPQVVESLEDDEAKTSVSKPDSSRAARSAPRTRGRAALVVTPSVSPANNRPFPRAGVTCRLPSCRRSSGTRKRETSIPSGSSQCTSSRWRSRVSRLSPTRRLGRGADG